MRLPSRHHPGIVLRIALLAWVVTLATLLIFALSTVPQQKKIFLQNLESKANSVAVSLRDVAAGAAVNEDYASLVSASQTLLAGDPDLDFLIIVKNDGYALINEQGRWSEQQSMDAFWRPDKRVAASSIETVPILQRRVFHFAQPFEYSGIQWGWIHVGLSLRAYDKSVQELYSNTLGLAMGCIVFSLVASVLYASQLVKPIQRLRLMVQRIAGGDLSVRAETGQRDELGSLAESVNTMAAALLRRDSILESVRYAAQQFLHSSDWESAIHGVLAKIGQAAEASHACLFSYNHHDNTCALHFEWQAVGMSTILDVPGLRRMPCAETGLTRWMNMLRDNRTVITADAPNPMEQAFLTELHIRSGILTPIFVDGTWWGGLGLADCMEERIWTEAEQDSLRAAADMIGATIARQRDREALLDAKTTLEARVRERTRELEAQVTATEQALSDLAAAQSSLLELSRSAGMAEVATGVLHNVGNVLNSINVSCNLLLEQLRESRLGNVGRVADLIEEAPDLCRFFTEDPRGRQIPAYLRSLANALSAEQQAMAAEAESLHSRIDHVKEIVAMQQTYGRVLGVLETLAPQDLMEDALKLNAEALLRHGVTVERRYEPVPPVTVDKHKVLQILLNLINNAKYASTHGPGEKRITLRIHSPAPDRVCLEVTDKGMGIEPENLTRIFQHGFTTRREGHGFGLHSGALAARDLGGSLNVHSDGPGRGATFTLEFPNQPGDMS